jgi:2-keto-4-pentenoate hydratase/2-oxohepta-3-ene-1,7-dioic acid hydratase in catechol pathway
MKFCSFLLGERARWGATHPAGGIIDLTERVRKYPTLLSLVQANDVKSAQDAAASASADHAEDDVVFLPLFIEQVAIHCVGLNYAAHTAEAGMKQPSFPRTFMKIRPSLVGHREAFEMPTLSHQFDFEGELAVVMAKPTRKVQAKDALDYVFGYTCFMDGSVRDYQLERTLDQGKNFRMSSSMGPYLVTADEVGPIEKLAVTTIVSGEQMQQSGFDKMIFPVPTLIEYVSGINLLEAGDVIATGTPEGVGFKRNPPRWLQPGDRVEVIIDRVGTLVNKVGSKAA